MSKLAGILLQALSSDEQARLTSQHLLQHEKQSSPELFLLELSRILAVDTCAIPTRQLAGILLKNTLLNLNKEDFLQDFWDKVTENSKEEIRNNTLGSLASPDRNVRMSAAQAVSSVVKLDLKKGQWKTIIEILVSNAQNENLAFKEASLITLGYICDGLDPGLLNVNEVDSILTAIASNMLATESNLEIKLIAFKAFRNSIRFAKKNIETQSERDYIMTLIFSGCQAADEVIRIESFKLLTDIASNYYDFVGNFLQQLGVVTFTAVRSDVNKVALLALEVWNTVGDIELERKEHPSTELPLRGYMLTAAPDLAGLILENIHKVVNDEDEWDVNKACASVLSVLTQITEDKIMDLCLAYIAQSLQNADWHYRTAALMVTGSILEGPSSMKIAPIGKHIPVLIQLLQDENAYVKQSAAWALSKIAQFQYKLVSQVNYFNMLLPALLNVLSQSPKIACHACWALVNLIEKSSELKMFKLGVFNHVFTALINSALRTDAMNIEHNLQLAAYSALSTLIEKAADDCIPVIEQQISGFVTLLKQHAGSLVNEQLHNCVCEVLCACFSRAGDVSDELCKEFLEALTVAFNTRNGVFEDGILAIGALAGTLGTRFVVYLPIVGPFITFTLQKQDAVSLCKAGTMLIGDIARALGEQAKPFVKDLMQPLIANLQNTSASSQVKVQSIESLADVVSNCKESTAPFLGEVLNIINDAAVLSTSIVKEEENPDLFEYFRDLREAIVEFYENLVQGLSTEAEALLAYIPAIVNYISTISNDKYRPRQIVHRCTIGIIGDLCKLYGQRIRALVKTQSIMAYVQRFRTSNNLKIRELANWAFSLLNSI